MAAPDPTPDPWVALWGWISGSLGAAVAGRLLWHAQEVKQGRRRFWSPSLAWELPTAVGMGMVADGVVDHLDLAGKPATALVVAIAYLGPRVIDAAFALVQHKAGGPPPPAPPPSVSKS